MSDKIRVCDIKVEVRFLRPDPCWVAFNRDESSVAGDKLNRVIYVFSKEGLAAGLIVRLGLDGFVPKQFSWDELAFMFGCKYFALVDWQGKNYWQMAPLI